MIDCYANYLCYDCIYILSILYHIFYVCMFQGPAENELLLKRLYLVKYCLINKNKYILLTKKWTLYFDENPSQVTACVL